MVRRSRSSARARSGGRRPDLRGVRARSDSACRRLDQRHDVGRHRQGLDVDVARGDAQGRARRAGDVRRHLGRATRSAGSILPTGSIDFLDGGQPIAGCVNQALSSLTATCSVSYPSAGTHSITARYDGDSNFTGSTSPSSGVQVVKGAPKAHRCGARSGRRWAGGSFYHPRYSEMTELKVCHRQGHHVLVQCSGKGCPFASLDIKQRVRATRPPAALPSPPPGARRADHRAIHARHWSASTTRSRSAPAVRRWSGRCLAPAASSPSPSARATPADATGA